MAADLFGRMMTTVAVRERIARRMGVSADDLTGIAWVTANVPATLKEPDAERRANDIAVSRRRYRLDIQSNSRLPILDLYAQAPSKEEAERLAAAAVAGLRDELRAIAASEGADFDESLMLRTLREPRGQVVNAGAGIQIAGLTFLVVFALSGCLLGLAVRARHGRDRRSAEPEAPPAAEPARGSGRGRVLVHPAVAAGGEAVLPRTLPSLDVAGALRIDRLRERATHGGDWPNTTRVLPWMLAAFIAILWLTPFNTISLSASLPFDLKLDRLVLPFILLAGSSSLLRGGPGAPRL